MKTILYIIVFFINIAIQAQNSRKSENDFGQVVHHSCYSYLKGEFHQDSMFSSEDTVHCILGEEELEIIRYFKDGEKYLTEAFYNNGNKYTTKSFSKGIEHGATIGWYKEGNIKEFIHYEYGYQVLSIFWYGNGVIKSVIEGEQHKGTRFFGLDFDTLGNIIGKSSRIDSLNNSLYYKLYYSTEIKRIETVYNSGKQQFVEYYRNGNTYQRGEILDVRFAFVGKWTEWYENGKVKREYSYNDSIPNLKDGEWKWWDENGILIKQETYKNNKLIESYDY